MNARTPFLPLLGLGLPLLGLPLLGAVSACSQEARVGDPVDGSVTADSMTADSMVSAAPRTLGEFLQSFADSYCARIESCCGGLPADFPSREWCVTSVTDELGVHANTELSSEYMATAVTCLEAVQSMGCAESNDARAVFDLFLTPTAEAACADAPLPRWNRNCADGSECDGECVDNICHRQVSRGSSCCAGTGFCSNSLCDELAYCDIDGDDLCHARRAVGEGCTDDSQCRSFSCTEATGQCAEATLESWICP
jgi:hypothetical protein